MRLSIFKKIFLSQMALIILAAGLISLASYFLIIHAYNEAQHNTLRLISSSTSMKIATEIAWRRIIFKEIAEAGDAPLSAQQYKELLLARNLARYQGQFSLLSHADSTGEQTPFADNDPGAETAENISRQKVFQDALAAPGQVVLGEVVLASASQTPVLQFAYSRMDSSSNQFLGLLFGQTPLAWLTSQTGGDLPIQKGYTLIVSSDGLVLGHPRLENIMKHLILGQNDPSSFLARLVTEPQGKIHQARINGEDCYFAIRLIPGTTWLAMAVMPARLYNVLPELLRNFSLLVFAALVLLISFCAFFISRSLTSPLRKFATDCKVMLAENQGQRLAEGDHEIGVLAQSFNAISDKLDQAQDREEQLSVINAGIRQQAQVAEQRWTEFFPKINHELRTQINIVLGMSKRLETKVTAATLPPEIMAIRQACQNLVQFMDGILDLNLVEKGELILAPVPFDPYAILSKLTKKYESVARIRNLKLVHEEATAIPTTVFGDETRIFQVLENLLNNAINSAEQGEILLQIRPLGLKASNDQHIIHLRFEITAPACGAMSNSGINLGLSRRIVELMHGEMEIKNEPGKGSIFWVDLDLPVAKIDTK